MSTFQSKPSELVQLKLNIETSVTKASSGGFRRSRTSQKELLAAKSESTPTEAEYEVPLPLVEVGVSRLDKQGQHGLTKSQANAAKGLIVRAYTQNELYSVVS